MDDRSVDEDSISSSDAVSTAGDEADDITLSVDGINLRMLKSLLKSYGTVRSFSLTKDVDPMKASASLYDIYVLTCIWMVSALREGISCGVLRPS